MVELACLFFGIFVIVLFVSLLKIAFNDTDDIYEKTVIGSILIDLEDDQIDKEVIRVLLTDMRKVKKTRYFYAVDLISSRTMMIFDVSENCAHIPNVFQQFGNWCVSGEVKDTPEEARSSAIAWRNKFVRDLEKSIQNKNLRRF